MFCLIRLLIFAFKKFKELFVGVLVRLYAVVAIRDTLGIFNEFLHAVFQAFGRMIGNDLSGFAKAGILIGGKTRQNNGKIQKPRFGDYGGISLVVRSLHKTAEPSHISKRIFQLTCQDHAVGKPFFGNRPFEFTF